MNKTLVVALSALSLAAVGADASTPRGMALDAFRAGEVVEFIGDSITHGGRQGDMNHYMGHGYAAEIASRALGYCPDSRVIFLNRGISGNTTGDLLRRWDRDAVHPVASERGWDAAFPGVPRELKPDVLSILIGINDSRHPDPARRVSADDYAKNLEELVSRALAENPSLVIVLCEPFHLPVDSSEDFLRRQAVAREVANRHGLCFVDFQRLFSETLARENPNSGYWFWDDFHPTYAAHIRMADYWLEKVGAYRAAHSGEK